MLRSEKPPLTPGDNYVILGSGLPAGLEHEVMPTIAEALGARYVSTSDAQTKVYAEGEDSFKGIARGAREVICQKVLQSLLVGQSVVCDADFFYTKQRRGLLEVAKFGGAATVGIYVGTPPEVAKSRVRRWLAQDAVGSPPEAWKGAHLRHIDTIFGSLQPITLQEVDYWMSMNGNAPVDQTVTMALAELAEIGIRPAV